MSELTVVLLFGGQSSEHDISCLSVKNVLKGLPQDKYRVLPVGITKDGRWLLTTREAAADGSWEQSDTSAWLLPDAAEHCLLTEKSGAVTKLPIDVVFPVLHGRFGEDGTVQGLCELARIPCVGCGTASSAVCMDKLFTKALVRELGIAQASYLTVDKHELLRPDLVTARIEAALPYPVFVKPSDGGSSQGVTCVENRDALLPALKQAASEGTRILVEEKIVGRELECAVLGRSWDARVCGVGEIHSAESFYSFDAKYSNPASVTDTAPVLPEGKAEEICQDARRIFAAVRGWGLARVDFFLEKDTDRVVFNEINTMPGFTDISMYPQLLTASGVAPEMQTELLIQLALLEKG